MRIKNFHRQYYLQLTFLCLGSLGLVCAQSNNVTVLHKGPGSLLCWKEIRTNPRPLALYLLKVAINDPLLEVVTIPSDDPDSIGAAEGKLTEPNELVTSQKIIAAVNANAFAGSPGSEKGGSGWYTGRFVDIKGLVVSDGVMHSPDEEKRLAFWIDDKGSPHISHPTTTDHIQQAVADWMAPLLIDNKIIPAKNDTVLHPRTLIGYSIKRNFILMVVVDGRQKGYSEGMSMIELAQLMKEQGCEYAINLDGGGSSVMLWNDEDRIETINQPSGKTHRPVPVMVGVRRRK